MIPLSIFDGRNFVCLVYPVIAAVGAGLGYPEYRREVGEGGDGGVEQFILLLHREHIRYPYQENKKMLSHLEILKSCKVLKIHLVEWLINWYQVQFTSFYFPLCLKSIKIWLDKDYVSLQGSSNISVTRNGVASSLYSLEYELWSSRGNDPDSLYCSLLYTSLLYCSLLYDWGWMLYRSCDSWTPKKYKKWDIFFSFSYFALK